MAVGSFLLGQIDAGTTIPTMVAYLSLQGFGMGLTAAPATVAGLNALPGRYVAQASALRSLNSQVSGAVAISALATLVASRMGTDPSVADAHAAYGWAFHASTCMLLLALVLAFRLPHVRRAQREPRTSGHVTAALLAE
jgi:MFS family permease